jgi:hypothetical protein
MAEASGLRLKQSERNVWDFISVRLVWWEIGETRFRLRSQEAPTALYRAEKLAL